MGSDAIQSTLSASLPTPPFYTERLITFSFFFNSYIDRHFLRIISCTANFVKKVSEDFLRRKGICLTKKKNSILGQKLDSWEQVRKVSVSNAYLDEGQEFQNRGEQHCRKNKKGENRLHF